MRGAPHKSVLSSSLGRSSKYDLDGKLQDARVAIGAGQLAEVWIGNAHIGQAKICAIEQIECFKAELPQSGLAQHGKAKALDHREVHIGEAWAFENIPAQRAQRVRSGIAEASRVEVPRDLLAFAAVSRQDGVSGADQVHARSGDACQRIAGRIDREESAGLQRENA